MYGSKPHHGYVIGGSGGSARCLLCLETSPDVWQGAVPYIMGHSTSWSLGFSVQAHAARVLGPAIAGVIDAVEPGGDGDPFAGLTTDQREALAAMYRAGFPRGAESSFGTSGYAGTFASHITALEKHDPTYIDDFWSVPGYMGADGGLAASLVDEKATVARVVTVAELAATGDPRGRMLLMFAGATDGDAAGGVVLDGVDPSVMVGAAMRFVTGNAAGRRLFCTGTVGDALLGGAGTGQRFEGVRTGDEVSVDNREYLAFTYFHRHQVDPRAPEYAQFTVDDRPMYPQRARNFAAQRAAVGRHAARRVHRQDDRGPERARRRVLAQRRAVVPADRRTQPRRLARRPLPPVVQRPRRPPAGVDQPGRRTAGPDDAPRRLRRFARAGPP